MRQGKQTVHYYFVDLIMIRTLVSEGCWLKIMMSGDEERLKVAETRKLIFLPFAHQAFSLAALPLKNLTVNSKYILWCQGKV